MNPAEYFANRLAGHPIHSSLAKTRSAVDEVALYEDEDVIAMAYRASFVLDRLELGLRRADPVAIPLGSTGLDAANILLGQAESAYRSYDQHQVFSNLEAADGMFDQILAQAVSFDKNSSGKLRDAATQVLTGMRQQSELALAEVRTALDDAAEKLSTAATRADEVQEEVNRKALGFNSELQRFGQRYEEEEDQRRKASREALEAIETAGDETHEKYQAELARLASETQSSFDFMLKEHTAKGKAWLDQLEGDRRESTRILGRTAEAGLIGGYQREANSKRWEAWIWRGAALLGFGATGFIAWTVLTPAADGKVQLNWEALVARSLLLAILGLTAAFAANEGRRASRIEEKNRSLELQLASVGPFIAGLEDEHKNEIKKEFVQRMYVPELEGKSGQEMGETAGTALQLVGQALNTLTEFVKSHK